MQRKWPFRLLTVPAAVFCLLDVAASIGGILYLVLQLLR